MVNGGMAEARAHILAVVAAEIAEMEAADASVEARLAQRDTRAMNAASVVYSIRLAPGEIRALERRAAALNMKPTVLARNLLRCGLQSGGRPEVRDALDRLEAAVRDVRTLAG